MAKHISISKTSFAELWNRGYSAIHPIIPPNAQLSDRSSIKNNMKGKIPGYVNGDGEWHGFDWRNRETTEKDIGKWDSSEAGIGFKGAETPAIDIDVLDKTVSLKIRELVLSICGDSPTRVGNPPKCLLPFSAAVLGEIPSGVLVQFTLPDHPPAPDGKPVIHRVEIIGNNKQWIGFGTHPKTLKPYFWDQPLPPQSELPVLTVMKLEQLTNAIAAYLIQIRAEILEAKGLSSASDRAEPPAQETLLGPLNTVRGVVENTPNKTTDWDDYLKYAAAIKAATASAPPDGLQIFLEWCSRWEGGTFDEETSVTDWEGLRPPYRIGYNYLIDHAAELGNREALKLAAGVDFEKLPPLALAQEGENEIPVEAATITPFSEVLYENVDSIKVSPYLIKGFMSSGNHAVWFGAPKSGKTFNVINIAFHIAAGKHWGTRKVRQGAVIYFAAEDGQGVLNRIKALKKRYGIEKLPFLIIPHQINLFKDKRHAQQIIERIRVFEEEQQQKVELVIFDTVAKCMTGGDENSSKDMGVFVSHVDLIKDSTGVAVISIHHTGKDAARGPRGSTALPAGIDGLVEIVDGEIETHFQRGMEMAPKMYFTLVPVEIGQDEDGDPITTCTVDVSRVSTAHKEKGGGEFVDIERQAEMVAISQAGLAVATAEKKALSHSPVAGGRYAPQWIYDWCAETRTHSTATLPELKTAVEYLLASGRWLALQELPFKRSESNRHKAIGIIKSGDFDTENEAL